MRWERITVQRVKNGFVIRVDFYPDKVDLYVVEGFEKEILEVLKVVFAGDNKEDSG